MTRALLITNPAAARTEEAEVKAILETLRRGGWRVELRATGGPGDARRFAAEAAAAGHDVVAVFGGDGTTMQAAAALVGTGTVLGVLPGGTGNLLAGNLRIPMHPARAAQVLLTGAARPLDLGRMERLDGTHYFAVACGAGHDARVMAATTTLQKHRWRFAAYFVTIFRLMPELRSIPHLITVDGVEYEAQAALVLVANCGEMIPPFLRLRRGIRPDDGLLDVVVLRADTLPETVRAIWEIIREDTGGRIGYAQGRTITVQSSTPEPVQMDGDAHGMTPFTAEVVPRAVHVIAPRSTS
ncbi:MAG: diacylglycerol kinase family lipid kinase [Gemmatimonadota bacterium]|nr:diacylglycerol kinase family lipid kinase [Gemmatimonadota bacterium]MDH4348206.1 diacylglycerol kinase family lipid kinase [Gemmatimonadota bacterium]MDH5283331.1 diacylglycerol kinase family lipid kinase [Gemmatimonadota bacterium]